MSLERVIAVGERTGRRLGIHLRLPRARHARPIGKPIKNAVAPKISRCPLSSITPITDAMVELLNRRVPNDPRGRIVADLLVEAMFREALRGNVKAIKEITDRVEGRIAESVPADPPIPRDNVTVIWPTSEQTAGKKDSQMPEPVEVPRSEAS